MALVDGRAQVLHPAHALTKGTDSTYSHKFSGAPVGRPHYARILLVHTTDTSKDKIIDILKPSFTVDVPNDDKAVNLKVPCSF